MLNDDYRGYRSARDNYFNGPDVKETKYCRNALYVSTYSSIPVASITGMSWYGAFLNAVSTTTPIRVVEYYVRNEIWTGGNKKYGWPA